MINKSSEYERSKHTALWCTNHNWQFPTTNTTINEHLKKLQAFFKNKEHEHFLSCLQSDFWVSKLKYLTEIFTDLISINTYIQERDKNILFKLIIWLPLKSLSVGICRKRAECDNFGKLLFKRKNYTKEIAPKVPLKTFELYKRNPSFCI